MVINHAKKGVALHFPNPYNCLQISKWKYRVHFADPAVKCDETWD